MMDKSKKIRIMVVLLILVLIAIFVFSSQSGSQSGSLSDKIYKLFFPNSQIIDENVSYSPIIFGLSFRKIAHLCIFFIVGLLLYPICEAVFDRDGSNSRNVVIKGAVVSTLICFVLAGADELHQKFSGGRDVLFSDVLIDVAGGVLGIVLSLLFCVSKKMFIIAIISILIIVAVAFVLRHIDDMKALKRGTIQQVVSGDEGVMPIGYPVEDVLLSDEHTKNCDKSIVLDAGHRSVRFKEKDLELDEDDVLTIWFWVSREDLDKNRDDRCPRLLLSINGSPSTVVADRFTAHAGFNALKLYGKSVVGKIDEIELSLAMYSESGARFFLDSLQLNYKPTPVISFAFQSDAIEFKEKGYDIFNSRNLTASFSKWHSKEYSKEDAKRIDKLTDDMLDEGFSYNVSFSGKIAEKSSLYDYNGGYTEFGKLAKELWNTKGNAIKPPAFVISAYARVGKAYDESMLDAGFMGVTTSNSMKFIDYFDEEAGEFMVCDFMGYGDSVADHFKKRIDRAVSCGYSITFLSTGVTDKETIADGKHKYYICDETLEEILDYLIELEKEGKVKLLNMEEYMKEYHKEAYSKWENSF